MGTMKMGESSLVVKKKFGSFLRMNRLKEDWSVYDVGRMIGTTQATVWCWEKGMSFPASIVKLKKLCLLYPDTSKKVKELVGDVGGIARWRQFKADIDCSSLSNCEYPGRNTCFYVTRDTRDMKYKIAFGDYLKRERRGMGVSVSSLAKALNVFHSNVTMWEAGTIFPQSLVVLSLLDRMYGNLFDVLFGLCKKHGIHLEKKEIRQVLVERDRVEGCSRWSHEKDGLWRET